MNHEELFAERIGGDQFGKDTTVYKFEKIKRAKATAQAANPGKTIIDFGVGEPDDMASAEARLALIEAVNRHELRGYADNGVPEFQFAVAEHLNDTLGLSLPLDRATEFVNHSIGGKNALALIPAAFINPNDVTIMPVPGYPVLGTWTKYMGGRVETVQLLQKNGFLPDLNRVEDICKRRGNQVKLFYANYPHNPTGAVATPEFCEDLLGLADKYNFLVINDGAYLDLTFDENPVSMLQATGGMDRSVLVGSMSKGYNMTGWRLGWFAGKPEIVSAIATVKDNADSGQAKFIQLACAEALAHQEDPVIIAKKYESRLERMVDVFRKHGFDVEVPKAGFLLYMRSPKKIDGVAMCTAEAASQYLINNLLISTVPWDDAGAYLRASATFEAGRCCRLAGDFEEENKVLLDSDSRLSEHTFEF